MFLCSYVPGWRCVFVVFSLCIHMCQKERVPKSVREVRPVSQQWSMPRGSGSSCFGEERRRGRTCVLVAHRLSTVQDADLSLVIDQGRIVARGDHSSLLAQNGRYADLFRRQRLSDELEAI